MTSTAENQNFTESNTLTGNRQKSDWLFFQLKNEFEKADRIDIIVSFLMTSGVNLLLPAIRTAICRGAKIRILTGKYLNITQPEALALLKKEFGEKIDLRFCLTDKNQSFHPKAYIFHKKSGSDIFVGSSNISYSALTSGIEWNYRFNSNLHPADFEKFMGTFEDLFQNHSVKITDEELRNYSKNYHKPKILSEIEVTPFSEIESENHGKIRHFPDYEPRGAQIEALYALQKSREEGAKKSLVFAATGIGKTYLAAFDSKEYEKVLFVVHQEEILKQAAESFYNVRHSDDYGFFYGKTHDTNKSVIFASVQTLGKADYLLPEFFPPDYFDYIIIDEFHHAVNKGYQNILAYFRPKFLLGLTATPERTDGRNIYEICDYNVSYELSLFQGINRGLLVPFHYYGIYDETDYSNMKFLKGDYLESELNKAYIGNENRSQLVFRHYQKYNSRRALGFCCSRLHAEYMAQYFCKRGVPSVAVYSNADGDFSENRDIAIKKLTAGQIKVIFSVNMFNEGVDIPSVDTVLFLRPTQSETVFLQQLGRGLRISPKKDFLTVLDFIGNYKNAGKFIKNLKEKKAAESGIRSFNEEENFEYPDGCFVDFDLEVIDILKSLERKNKNITELIKEEFYRVRELLDGKIPGRTELFTNMDGKIYELCLKYPKLSPFKDYLGFLKDEGLLSDGENMIYNSICKDFLSEIENTSMTKSYKMPVLLAFYNNGNILQKLFDKNLLDSWKQFFSSNCNWKDLPKAASFSSFKNISDKEHLLNIKKNPVYFLVKSGHGFFQFANDGSIYLNENLIPFLQNQTFIKHFKDSIDFRTLDYYARRYREKSEASYKIPDDSYLMVAEPERTPEKGSEK